MTYEPSGDVFLSRADLTAAMRELDSLRGAHRLELAAMDDDDHLAVLEDAAVERIKIAQLERLIASATIVEAGAADDLAGLGSVVRVKDRHDREIDYELVGRLSENPRHTQVTPASPVGKVLMGARGGDVVHVSLPSGRARTLTVVAVSRADDLAGDQGSISPRRIA
jgi:transcription elongation factor GreA